MTSTVASQTPVSDDEICGDVDMKTVEPSSVAPGEVSTTFTPINGQEDTAPTHEEGEAGLEKVIHLSLPRHHNVLLLNPHNQS